MKIGYGMNCDPADLRALGAERVYVDHPKSERRERAELFGMGLRRGDVLLLLSRSHLGRGKEIQRFEQMAEDMGVSIEVLAQEAKPLRGRTPRFDPTPDQERRIRHYWHGPFLLAEALRQAKDIMGHEVTRNSLNHRLGPRSKPRNVTKET